MTKRRRPTAGFTTASSGSADAASDCGAVHGEATTSRPQGRRHRKQAASHSGGSGGGGGYGGTTAASDDGRGKRPLAGRTIAVSLLGAGVEDGEVAGDTQKVMAILNALGATHSAIVHKRVHAVVATPSAVSTLSHYLCKNTMNVPPRSLSKMNVDVEFIESIKGTDLPRHTRCVSIDRRASTCLMCKPI